MLSSVNPNQPSPGAMPMEDTEVGNGIGIPQTPIPGANPMDTTAMSTLKGSKMEADAMNNMAKSASKGSSGIGGILGAVGGIAGKLLGGLFNQGGYVRMAQGGQAMNPDNTYGPGQTIEPPPAPQQPGGQNMAYGIGYALGALHQRDFNGTPETLEQAAEMIKQMMSGQQFNGGQETQMAAGPVSMEPASLQSSMRNNSQIYNEMKNNDYGNQAGKADFNTTHKLRQELQSKGLKGFAQGGSANPAMQPPNPMQSSPQPQLPPQPQMPPRQPGFMQPNMGMPQQRLATGGPPLQPGQPFMGEGEVDGPTDGSMSDDAIPAKLTDGEYVMSAPAVAFFGVEKMDKLNEQGKQGFMQSQAQVQANQSQPPGPPSPQGTGVPAGGPPSMPPGGGRAMAPMGMPPMPTMQAQGGPAVRRTRGSGFMGL